MADVSIWSDEVEMLAKLRADMILLFAKKTIRWERLLPERFIESATATVVPTGSVLKSITRGLSSMLDRFVKTIS